MSLQSSLKILIFLFICLNLSSSLLLATRNPYWYWRLHFRTSQLYAETYRCLIQIPSPSPCYLTFDFPEKSWSYYRKGLLSPPSSNSLKFTSLSNFFLIYSSDLFIWLLLWIPFPARWATYGVFNTSVSFLSLGVLHLSFPNHNHDCLALLQGICYLIYLAHCSINDLVTVSLKVLHYSNLEIKVLPFKKKSLNWFISKQKMSILIFSSLLYLLWPRVECYTIFLIYLL